MADQLDDFLKELPRDFRYGVELRNPELMTGVHGEVLKRHGVAHVFNSWTEMPPIGEQIELGWTFSADFTVARALLKPGRRYSDAVKQFQPYDRVQEPQPALRRDLLQLINTSLRRRIEPSSWRTTVPRGTRRARSVRLHGCGSKVTGGYFLG